KTGRIACAYGNIVLIHPVVSIGRSASGYGNRHRSRIRTSSGVPLIDRYRKRKSGKTSISNNLIIIYSHHRQLRSAIVIQHIRVAAGDGVYHRRTHSGGVVCNGDWVREPRNGGCNNPVIVTRLLIQRKADRALSIHKRMQQQGYSEEKNTFHDFFVLR